ncbi:ATP-binding protein [Parabacteroides sp. PF5-6]|uniref:ATP-binding protein n=1 Tax=Parabacteroides sp. PF5-6 TaxID=1742403 RepID=UPI002405CC12|nr:ATP-binding protein [Parabacteroides sp. PF5-6]MDF9829566.1 hypothetical protein [Parabacteroides sp. PF5-6]
MNNLSFHITDIVANSIRAGATQVTLAIAVKETITIEVKDNGCGMDQETLQRVTNPFYTTRTTRKVGLGLPFLIQNAEQTGGKVVISSVPGEGTDVSARFIASHIDCPPWGDLAATVATTITGNPEVNICFRYETDQNTFIISTEEIKEALDGIPLSLPKVTVWLEEMIRENLH